MREPSNKNILDEFDEKENSDIRNFNNLSFDAKLMNSTPFENLLEMSIISYFNEKDMLKKRSKHDIESNKFHFSYLISYFFISVFEYQTTSII